MHFSSVFTREDTCSLPVPETTFNGSEGEDFRDRTIPYSETVLSPLRFNINCTRQVAAHLLRCVVSSFFIRCSLQIEPIVNRVITACASG